MEEYVKDPTKKKSPGIAAITSFFIPGLGQIYNGDLIKGMAFIITGTMLALLAFIFAIPALMAPVLRNLS